ncbi:MAG: ATP-binding protein [Bacteroidota bacterium]
MEMHNKTTILAIDDNPDNLASLKAVLNDLQPDARILTALTGQAGIDLARSEDPDMLLLDIIMPDMDGFEVCRVFKKDQQLKHIPVVFLTAQKTRRDLRIAALEAGADGFLSKPLDEIELLAQVKAMLQIRSFVLMQRRENERLNMLVASRTEALQKELEEHRTADQLLRESEARFRAMLEHSPLAYQALDEEGKYIDVNDEYCRLLGHSRSELIGKQCSDFWIPEDRPLFAESFGNFLSSNVMVGDLRLQHKSGNTIEVHVEGQVQRDSSGSFIRTHCVLINITEQNKLNRQLVEAKERAEESDRLKSTFLANMSHEVRTPMNAIIGFSELLNEPDLPRDAQQEYTEIIRQRSYDLLQIINDILNISLIDAGEVIITPEISNVKVLLTDLYITFNQLAASSKEGRVGIEYCIDLDESEIHVMIDSGRIRQVLTNLISNALKFTHKGTVRFGCKRQNKHELIFYVEDTGIGVPSEAQTLIFGRFRQADDSSSRLYGGTGLGLSISKELVELMGGRIWVESNQNTGSTFCFSLPYNAVPMKLQTVE